MAKTSKNNIYYNDDENSIADVLADMKKLAESTDEAIENVKYDDKQIKQNISNIEEKNTEQEKNITNNTKSIEELKTENETLKAENKLIKEQIPSASASGNSVHIEDSGTLDFDWKINGGHKQETRDGRQLFNKNDYVGIYQGYYDNGVLNKKDIRHNWIIMKYEKVNAELSYYYKNTTNGYNIVFTNLLPDEGVPVLADGSPYYYKTTSPDNSKYVMFYIGSEVENDWNFEERLNSLMVEETSERLTANDYEQYGVSPSPGYPSEVETVGSNVNFIPTNPDEWEQGSISNGKNISSTTRIRSKGFIDIVEGEDYYLSIQDNQYRFVNIVLYKDDNTYLNAYSSYDIAIKKEYFLKVNFPTGCKKIRFVIRKVDDTSSIIPSEIDVIKPKLEKGTVQTPWSPYNQGSVEIDVVNKNLLDKNNEKKGITINAAGVEESSGARSTTQYITVDKNKKVLYVNWSGKTGKQNPGYTILLSYDSNKKLITRQPKYNETSSKNWTFDISNASFIRVTYEDLQVNNGEYGVENTIISYEKTEYEEHQSQTAIMPVQQEMLEGDYVADVEHHEWGKLILTGDESWNKSSTTEIDRFSYNTSDYPAFAEGLSNCFLVKKGISLETGILIFNAGTQIVINFSNYGTTTLEEFKAWLKSKYDEGSPVIIYYKLAEPLDLELTAEQKAIRDTKLYTYKNITNISVDSELASIEVTYKKDLETEHNKFQNEIDEIKQLISTTETSALLLDNLQKDAEMEVE